MRKFTDEDFRRTKSYDFRSLPTIHKENNKYYPGKSYFPARFKFKKDGIERSVRRYKLEQLRKYNTNLIYPGRDPSPEEEPLEEGEEEKPEPVLPKTLSIFTKGNKGCNYQPFSDSINKAKHQLLR